jgi:hypothetical protein
MNISTVDSVYTLVPIQLPEKSVIIQITT